MLYIQDWLLNVNDVTVLGPKAQFTSIVRIQARISNCFLAGYTPPAVWQCPGRSAKF
jgi:hypothetical protein